MSWAHDYWVDQAEMEAAERHADECGRCGGRGDVESTPRSGRWVPCPACGGSTLSSEGERKLWQEKPVEPVPPVVPCLKHELPHVAEKQAQKMLGVPSWR